MSKVNIRGSSECWPWRGHRHYKGYGLFKLYGTQKKAHRIAWEIKHGPIPAGLCVLHKCDNRPCVNPRHLFLGTHKDNAIDRENKGRGRQPRGEKNGQSRLTEKQILKIRSLYSTKKYKQVELAQRFDVNQTTVSAIVTRKNWKHI